MKNKILICIFLPLICTSRNINALQLLSNDIITNRIIQEKSNNILNICSICENTHEVSLNPEYSLTTLIEKFYFEDTRDFLHILYTSDAAKFDLSILKRYKLCHQLHVFFNSSRVSQELFTIILINNAMIDNLQPFIGIMHILNFLTTYPDQYALFFVFLYTYHEEILNTLKQISQCIKNFINPNILCIHNISQYTLLQYHTDIHVFIQQLQNRLNKLSIYCNKDKD